MSFQDKKSALADSITFVTKDSAALKDDEAILEARSEMYHKGQEQSREVRENFLDISCGLAGAVVGVAVALAARKLIRDMVAGPR